MSGLFIKIVKRKTFKR